MSVAEIIWRGYRLAPGEDLRRAKLAGFDFRDTGLESLADADLRGADLRGVIWSDVRLTSVRFDDADASESDWSRVGAGSLTGARFDGVNFLKATMPELVGLSARRIRARRQTIPGPQAGELVNRSGIDFAGAYLTRCHLAAGLYAGTSFRGAFLKKVDFAGSRFEGASFAGAYLERARFSGCTLIRCSFRRADVAGVEWGGAELVDCDVDGANVGEAGRPGSAYEQQGHAAVLIPGRDLT